MKFFRDATFQWNGESYSFSPNMRLLMRIESEGLSSEKISYEAMNGNIMKASMARFMGVVMREAGLDITDERLLQEVEHNSGNALDLFKAIRDALYTEPPAEMVADAPKDDGKKKG